MNKENDKLSFVYSFNMGNDIAHFKLFPDQVKSAAECNVVDVIYESFVVTGDHDYVMSRLLALNGLHRGFYWAAAQTIEKYLKAFLLMNGEDIRGFKGHPLKKLFQAACKIDVTLKDLDIQPHPVIHIENTCTHLVKKFIIFEFISKVEKYGGPNNRYNSTGVEFNTGHLFALDSFAYKLRGMIGAVSIEKKLK